MTKTPKSDKVCRLSSLRKVVSKLLKEIAKLLYMRKVSPRKDVDTIIWGDFGRSFERLFSTQVEGVLQIVDNEVAKSYDHGLKLDHQDVLHEKLALLTVLNSMGSLHLYPQRYTFDEAMRRLDEALNVFLAEARGKYFDRLEAAGITPHNMYDCHLLSLKGRLMNGIYNGEV